MFKFIIFLTFAAFLTGCASIDFGVGVRCASSDSFIDECKFSKADSEHFIYKNSRPSIIFIYSDAVEHCRKQAKVFSSVAELYSDNIFFWAIEYGEAKSLLSFFKDDGRLPIYLYINQNCAQMFAPETTSPSDMCKHIGEAFNIF